MKTILTTLLILISNFYFSQNLITDTYKAQWLTDYDSASRVSISEGKPLMVLFTGSDWCGWCIRLQREVFSDTTFVNWSKNVVLVEIDFPRDKFQSSELKRQNQNLQNLWNIQGYPTVLFIKVVDGKYQLIGNSGYIPGGSKNWINNANEILENNF